MAEPLYYNPSVIQVSKGAMYLLWYPFSWAVGWASSQSARRNPMLCNDHVFPYNSNACGQRCGSP